jgi:hypothetical protein
VIRLEDQRKIKCLVEGIVEIFFLFFALNQYISLRFLIELSILNDYETTGFILTLNYWIMIAISFSLVSLAIYDSQFDNNNKPVLIFMMMFVGVLAIVFPLFLNNLI